MLFHTMNTLFIVTNPSLLWPHRWSSYITMNTCARLQVFFLCWRSRSCGVLSGQVHSLDYLSPFSWLLYYRALEKPCRRHIAGVLLSFIHKPEWLGHAHSFWKRHPPSAVGFLRWFKSCRFLQTDADLQFTSWKFLQIFNKPHMERPIYLWSSVCEKMLLSLKSSEQMVSVARVSFFVNVMFLW